MPVFQQVRVPGSPITPRDVRSVLTADFDRDGRVDILTTHMSEINQNPLHTEPECPVSHGLFRNITRTEANWVAFRLVGDFRGKTSPENPSRSSRDGVGGLILLRGIDHDADPDTLPLNLRRDLAHGGSNLASMHDRILHFGLGLFRPSDLDYIIQWPDGTITIREKGQGGPPLPSGVNHAYKMTQIRIDDRNSKVKVELIY